MSSKASSQGSSQDYGAAVAAELLKQTPGADQALLVAFAQEFWLGVQPEDLAHRTLERDVELTRDAFMAFTRFERDQPQIEWVPGAIEDTALLRVLHPDMPFITDSILMALQRADTSLLYLHNVTLAFERDERGQPHRLSALDRHSASAVRETLIYAELAPLSDPRRLAISEDLNKTLHDVRQVVADHSAMRERAEQLATDISQRGGSDNMETAGFLRWLCEDHFTFLGFRSFSFEDDAIEQVSGSTLGILRLRPPATRRQLATLQPSTREFLLEPTPLSFSKAGTPSRVHRPAYPDYIGVKRLNAQGEVIGEDGFLGLYTSPVYRMDPATIPVLRRKVAWVQQEAGYLPGSHDAKALQQILNTYPRDELLQTPRERLLETATAIAHIHERRLTRVFLWRGRYGMFFNCMVYLPRDALSTRVRLGIQQLLCDRLDALDVEFELFFSESVLVRLQYILRVDPRANVTFDRAALEADIIALASDWRGELRTRLQATPAAVHRLAFADGFPTDYQERFDQQVASYDIDQLLALAPEGDLRLRFYRDSGEDNAQEVQLKLFRQGDTLPLSKIVPVLEHFGFEVLTEHPYRIDSDDGVYSIQDLTLRSPTAIPLESIGDLFENAFSAIWQDRAESDALNALVLLEHLDWQQIALLRSYARYMKQAAFGFEQAFIEQTLLKHSPAAKLLIAQFVHRLHPEQQQPDVSDSFMAYLQQIELLNEDQVLRQLYDLVQATLRSNYFAERADAGLLVHKIAAQALPRLPQPRPLYEIYTYSPDFEGVHLRSSPVARGGIRWSDRQEDYRTEVLGLVKAQIVKNAVIVPNGAKGGFVAKRDLGADAGLKAYRRFITAALSLTDNLRGGQIEPPPGVFRRDGDDPYFVVAADKGTATFSDTANEIALEQGFWLGDAFASGGSVGYDHKKMGITAKGAWISVQRHFRTLGIDPQRQSITVVGIGDMGGDVFGNGMLRSKALKLVAAFNHLHIFIDPEPDPAVAFAERERLFALPRSSWSQYDQTRISAGGGVYSRTQKSIPISEPMQRIFAIEAQEMTGDELIQALLTAPVDLLWNGGIGTYVKARSEAHADVGDRTNDALRINGSELRAKVVGEGGNLGLTHLGRIEYAQTGGLINADFIDNAAGVDCSDHEVNLKILLGEALAQSQITTAERTALLRAEEDAISELVLANNFVQARCLSLARAHARGREDEYNRLATTLEAQLDFDRAEADFPAEEILEERRGSATGLFLPELSTLLGNAKLLLKQQLETEQFQPEPELAALAAREFPPALAERFSELIPRHRLYREIAITVLTNDLVGFGGITFVSRIMAFVGCEAQDAVRAYWICARVFRFQERIDWIDGCAAAPEVREALMLDLIRLMRRSVRWLIRRHRANLEPAALIGAYAPAVQALLTGPGAGFLSIRARAHLKETAAALGETSDGQPLQAAGFELFDALAIAELANRSDATPEQAGTAYREVGELLQLDELAAFLADYEAHGHWRAMERDALLDDLCEQQLTIAAQVLASSSDAHGWVSAHETLMTRWQNTLSVVSLAPDAEFSGLSMTVRKLVDLLGTYAS
ncbi:MAG: NAD-glutamate dehydrogenase [Pseudomonadota bacterium]